MGRDPQRESTEDPPRIHQGSVEEHTFGIQCPWEPPYQEISNRTKQHSTAQGHGTRDHVQDLTLPGHKARRIFTLLSKIMLPAVGGEHFPKKGYAQIKQQIAHETDKLAGVMHTLIVADGALDTKKTQAVGQNQKFEGFTKRKNRDRNGPKSSRKIMVPIGGYQAICCMSLHL